MREAENGEASPGSQPESKKARLIRQLTAEIDQIKREIERSKNIRNKSRILYEFERPSPFNYIEVKYVNVPERRASVNELDETARVEMAMNYIVDARTVMLTSILKQSKKIVFSDEWQVGHDESKIIDIFDKVDRERKKNRLFRVSGGTGGIDRLDLERTRNRILDREIERAGKLRQVKQELMCLAEKRIVYNCNNIASGDVGHAGGVSIDIEDRVGSMDATTEDTMCSNIISSTSEIPCKVASCGGVSCGNGIVPRTGGDNPPNIFMARILNSSDREKRKMSSKTEALEVFKRYLSNFSKCNSSQSSRNSFQMVFPSAGIHPTNQYILKKIPVEYLRCKSVKEIIDHKYRNVVVEKTVLRQSSTASKHPLDLLDDDSFGDLCSSKSDDNELELSFFLNSNPDKVQEKEGHEENNEVLPGRINLETPFDKFLNEKSRKDGVGEMESSLHSTNPRFTDFIKNSAKQGQAGVEEKSAHPKFINEFYRSFPSRIDGPGRISFETIKDGKNSEEEKRGKSPRDKHQII